MDELWFLYLAIFALVFLAVQLLLVGVRGLSRARRETRRRFDALAGPEADELTEILRRSARGADLPLVRRFQRLVLQSGTRATSTQLGLTWLAIVLLALLVLPVPAGVLVRFAVALAVAIGVLGAWLWMKRARRLARFGEQLPEILDIVVRSLRAGHPLPVSLGLVAREMTEPAGPEFALLVDEVGYGRSVTEALENLYQRVGYPELRFFVASTAIAHQTGGNLGEILSRLSRMLRERFRLMRRVRALSAEGRFSGYALSVLPVALFGLINVVSPAYYAEFWRSAASSTVLAVSLALLVLGNLVIYRLVNLKV